MTSTLSARARLLSWIKYSRVLVPVKKFIPDFVKRNVLAVIAGGQQGVIDLGNGTKIKYNLSDSYWARYANNIRDYEPEIWFLLDRYLTPDSIFIDCGANIGLWSCYAASKVGNRDQVIAVEPSDSILPLLRLNHALNGKKFLLLERAIWYRSGETMSFTVYSGHASSSLVETDLPLKPLHKVSVQTVCIDDIMGTIPEKAMQLNDVVVKLDVEGAEQQALAGASRTLVTKNTLLIYEDHGRDLNSETTAYFFGKGLNIYFIDDESHGVRRISDIVELTVIKADPGKGYNFIACRAGTKFDEDLSGLCVY